MEENEWLETICPDCLQKYKTLEDIDKELEYFASLNPKEPRL